MAVALGGAAIVVFAATPASAQTDPDESALARMHADAALRLTKEGRFVEAAEEYEKGYAVSSDPELLFPIGEAYRSAGNPDRAAGAYRSFLDKAPASPNRAEAEKRLAEVTAASAHPAPATAPRPVPAAPAPAPATAPGAPSGAALAASGAEPAPPRSGSRWWLWTALGVAVAASAVAVGLALSSAPRDEPIPGRTPPGIIVIK